MASKHSSMKALKKMMTKFRDCSLHKSLMWKSFSKNSPKVVADCVYALCRLLIFVFFDAAAVLLSFTSDCNVIFGGYEQVAACLHIRL